VHDIALRLSGFTTFCELTKRLHLYTFALTLECLCVLANNSYFGRINTCTCIYIYILYTDIKRGELFGRNGGGRVLKCTSVRGHSLLIIIIHTFARPLLSAPRVYRYRRVTHYMPSRPKQKRLLWRAKRITPPLPRWTNKIRPRSK